jgi:hypothetical protein
MTTSRPSALHRLFPVLLWAFFAWPAAAQHPDSEHGRAVADPSDTIPPPSPPVEGVDGEALRAAEEVRVDSPTDPAVLEPGPQAVLAPEPRPLPPVQAIPPDPTAHVIVSAEAGRGVMFRREDDAFAIGFRARFQMRDTLTFVDDHVTNEVNIRTVRFFTHGHLLTPDLRYLVQLAFGPSEFDPASPTPIFDAFAEYVGVRDLSVRAGQFFVPFDRARTIREFALQLVDRQLVVQELNLDRDAGAMVFSQDLFGLDGTLAYALGVFGGSGRNRVETGVSTGLLYVARLSVRPFGPFDDDVEGDLARLPKPRLALGIAGAYNHRTDRQRGPLGPNLRLGTFDYRHAAADLVFKYRGLSVLGEVLYRESPRDFREGVVEGVDVREWSRSAWGYLLQAGFLVTDRLEVAGRYDELRALGSTDPELVRFARGQGRELGAGLNYYLNGHYLKLQGDYVRRFGDGSLPTVQMARLQLDASF